MWVFLLLGIEAIRTYRVNPYLVIATYNIPTWTSPIALLLCISALVPSSSFLGHVAGLVVGYTCMWMPQSPLLCNGEIDTSGSIVGLGYLKILAPPEKILRWIEGKLNLLGRLPHYVSVDQKTYGRFGVLPSSSSPSRGPGVGMGIVGSGQRLGP